MPELPLKIRSKSSLPMLIILLALVTGFIFYFQIIRPGQINEHKILLDAQKELLKLRVFKSLQLNFSIFDRTDFKSLRIFGEVPVKTAPGGKTDLFSQ